MKNVNTAGMWEHAHRGEACRRTDLWGESVSDGVHVVAGCRGAHESVGVAGEAVAIGREAVSGAAVGAQTPLVHGGRRQGLGSVQRAALCHREQQHQQVREERGQHAALS